MALGKDRPKPGLKAIYEGREQRKPGGKYARPTTAVYLFGVGAIVASLFVYKLVDNYQRDSAKRDLLAGQRALRATIGAEWEPLRQELETYVLEAAKSYAGDFVDSEAARWDFRAQPGLYLRMRVADVKDAASLHQAAAGSTRDAFVGCLLREPNAAAAHGEPDAGAFPEQPWNLAKAYTATRILGDEWGDQVKAADDEMRLRVVQQQYEKAAKVDMKLAAEVIKQAKFFLLVLDEDPDEPTELAKAKLATDGGALDEGAIQLVPHWTRVYVLDLRTKHELLRLRRQGSATFRFVGERAMTDPETQQAMQRQVNNCNLADQVREAIAEHADGGAP